MFVGKLGPGRLPAMDVSFSRSALMADGTAYHWALRVGPAWVEVLGTGKTDLGPMQVQLCDDAGLRELFSPGSVERFYRHSEEPREVTLTPVGHTDRGMEDIRDFVKDWIRIHPRYHVHRVKGSNCQTFVTDLAEFLGVELPIKNDHARGVEKVFQVSPVIGNGAGMLTAKCHVIAEIASRATKCPAAACSTASATEGVASGVGVAARALGGVAGGLSVAGGVATLGFAIHDIIAGDVDASSLEVFLQRLQSMMSGYDREAESPAKADLLSSLAAVEQEVAALIASLHLQNTGTGVASAASGVMSIGGGGCLLVSAVVPVSAPVIAVVGAALLAASTATNGGCAVGKSLRGYKGRARLIQLHDAAVSAQLDYAQVTGCLKDGITARVGSFTFSGSYLCQAYMTIQYETSQGQAPPRSSCDLEGSEWFHSWYGATMRLEPEARNVVVSFDVRGGCEVAKVDRSAEGCPFLPGREEFFFPDGDVEAEFELDGPAWARYVSKARWRHYGGMWQYL